jgi:hypothetical protein
MKPVQLIFQISSRYYLKAINKPIQSLFPSFSFQIDSIFQWNSRNNNSSMPPLVIEGISNNTSLDSSKEENIFDMTFLFAAPKSKVFSKLFSLLMVLRLTS